MTQPMKVISATDARRLLADHYAQERALARKNAPTTPCIHDIMLASCVTCLNQDPHELVLNRTTGDEEWQPVNEIVTTKNSARGYENRTTNALYPDGRAWVLQREQRAGV